MMNLELSGKIKCLSLIMTYMVVLRHSLNMVAFYNENDVPFYVSFIEFGFSILTEIAIPFFFIVSGFFFLRYNYYNLSVFLNTIKKKFWTLLIPFVIWNLVGMITMSLTGLLQRPDSIIDFIQSLLLSEYYGPLWYVRNIMILMLFVPLYYWVFQYNRWWVYLLVFILLYSQWLPVDCRWCSSEGVLFFFVGGVLQRHQGCLDYKVNSLIVMAMFFSWGGLAFFRPGWSLELNKATTLLGVITFWFIYDNVHFLVKKVIGAISSYSFQIYVLHFFIVKGLKVFIAGYYPNNAVVALSCYFGLPIVVFVGLLYLASLWKRRLPKLYSICVGGR